MIDRRLVDFSQRLPLRALASTVEKLHALRGEIVRAGGQRVLGIKLPIFPKARFQEGCSANPRLLSVSRDDVQRLKALVLGGTEQA